MWNILKFFNIFKIVNYVIYNLILTFYTFINFRDINIYESTVIDRMHHLDLRLFNYQITYTFDLLKDLYRALILDIIDNR